MISKRQSRLVRPGRSLRPAELVESGELAAGGARKCVLFGHDVELAGVAIQVADALRVSAVPGLPLPMPSRG